MSKTMTLELALAVGFCVVAGVWTIYLHRVMASIEERRKEGEKIRQEVKTALEQDKKVLEQDKKLLKRMQALKRQLAKQVDFIEPVTPDYWIN